MRSRVCLAIAAALLPLHAQTKQPAGFDVASVRPTRHGEKDAQGFTHSSQDIPSPGSFLAENSSLDELIRFAYNLREYQISGPVWLNDKSENFDVLAKTSPDTPKDQMREMLQTLLAERFNLTAHRENKRVQGYELVVGGKGPKLSPVNPAGHKSTSSAGGNVTATKVTMADFAYELSRYLNCPVFDKTALEGAFDITLQYALENDSTSTAPSLFTAIQETTGLKLESAKVPVEMLVIDHIEKAPTEN